MTNLSEEEGGSRDEVCRKIDILAADFLPFDIGLIILRPLYVVPRHVYGSSLCLCFLTNSCACFSPVRRSRVVKTGWSERVAKL